MILRKKSGLALAILVMFRVNPKITSRNCPTIVRLSESRKVGAIGHAVPAEDHPTIP
jgi:hypothetical protein